MKSTPTPRVATGVTAEVLTVKFGATGGIQHEVLVPAGTRCKKLNGGSDPWVVDDLGFIPDKQSLLHWDASVYGIRVPESKISGITEVRRGKQ